MAGIARGCRENGCALLGGETAEMPGFYADGEYDIAGFIVGAVERSRIVDGRTITAGDVLIGVASAGLHTNGYSLARRVLFDVCGWTVDTYVPDLQAEVGVALLAPHRSYLRAVRPLLERSLAKGLAHITGGGITDNLPRILPPGTAAEISRAALKPPPIFRLLQHRGGIADDEMLRAFNMGIGLIVACAPEAAEDVTGMLHDAGERDVYRIGRIVPGDRLVRYT